MGLFAIYLFLATFCALHSTILFNVIKHETDTASDDLKLNAILTNISSDDNYCFHCIERRIGFARLKTLVKDQRLERKRDVSLRRVRTLFNTLSIVNSIVVFLIFGGPKSISSMSLFSLLSIFGSIYVERATHTVLFESVVILVSAVVVFQTSYVIFAQAVLLERRNRWDVSFFSFSSSCVCQIELIMIRTCRLPMSIRWSRLRISSSSSSINRLWFEWCNVSLYWCRCWCPSIE